MPKEGTEAKVLAALEEAAAAHGIDIVDVEVVGTSKVPCVRVRIDHADELLPTITLDEVTDNSRWISDALDKLDPFAGSYTLEVSSPGLDRPLRRPHDFERFAGERVSLVTSATEGRRRYTAMLVGYEDDSVILDCDGERVYIDINTVKKCNIKPDFSEFGARGNK